MTAAFVALLLACLVLPGAAAANSSSAPGWYWLNPLPTGFNQYTGASMVGDEVWVATNGESLLHSADGGRTWTTHPTSDGTGSFDRVAFVSSSVGYATRDGVGVFRTETGGAVWNQVLDLSTADVCDLFVLDGLDVWVQTANPAYSYWTTNGGASWQGASVPTTLRDVVFTDAQHGWAVGNVIALNASSQW